MSEFQPLKPKELVWKGTNIIICRGWRKPGRPYPSSPKRQRIAICNLMHFPVQHAILDGCDVAKLRKIFGILLI